MKQRSKSDWQSKFYYVLLIVIFFALMIVTDRLTKKYDYIHIKKYVLEIGRLTNLLAIFQTIVTIGLSVGFRKKGFVTAVVLYSMCFFDALIEMIVVQNLANVHVLCMSVSGIFIIAIIFRYAQALSKIANEDALTGISNRRGLMEYVDKKIKQKKRFAFIMTDLDEFKKINDVFGHDQGDVFLIKFAQKWKVFAKKHNFFISRIGGDEFVFICETNLQKEEITKKIKGVLSLWRQKRDNIYTFNDSEVAISASIGISVYPDDGQTYTDLFRYSDIAMYRIKNNGKQGVVTYQADFLNQINNDTVIESKIINALHDESFFVVFQPQYNIKTNKLSGAEVLVRMKDKEGKVISPFYFIPVAEKSKLIVEIDFFVFESALKTFLPFVQKDKSLILSVNFSVKSIFSENYFERLNSILESTGYPLENLQVEVTESLVISAEGKEAAKQKLDRLHEMGIKLAIDDFGTGYSSLSYLKELPFDTLKIDKAFVDVLSENEEDNAFVKAIIALGHILSLKIVAEGVETHLQEGVLKENGCDVIQGYLYSKPVSIEEFPTTPDIPQKN